MSYSASFMACQIPLKLGLPSGVRGARYAVVALGFAAAAAGVAGAVRGVWAVPVACARRAVGGVARVAGAVCAHDGEALKHNAHEVSVIAILKAVLPADTPIKKAPLRYRLGWLASAMFIPLFQHVRER